MQDRSAEFHGGWVKRQMLVIIARISAEVLQIRILLNLKCRFFIRIAIFCLNDAGTQSKTQWLCNIPFSVSKQGRVPFFDIQSGNRLGLLHPAIAFFQMHTYRLLEICQTDLPVAVFVHTRHPACKLFGLFCRFPCKNYTTNRRQSLALQGDFIYSVGIN